MVMTWLVIKRKHLRHDNCCCSTRGRHWLHMLGFGPGQSMPTEADGVPVKPQPTECSVRVRGGQFNELPAHDSPATSSGGSSIVGTPVRMYFQEPETSETPDNFWKHDPQ